MGVSGSGKSTVGEDIAAAKAWPFIDGDELHPRANVEKMAQGHPLTDEDRVPWLAAIAAAMDVWTREGVDGVVACSALKRAYRDVLRGNRSDVWFLFLDVDPVLLEARLRRRHGHFMPSTLLPSQLSTLEKPGPDERAVTVRIDSDASAEVNAQRAITALDAAVQAETG